MKPFFATFITLILLTGGSLHAQDYNQAIGVRGGLANGISYKASLDGNNGFDLILSTLYRGFAFTALYERHTYPFDVDGLYAYYGAGGHIGSWNGTYSPWLDNNVSALVIGVDGVIGMEYTFDDLPICLSLDWKPIFNLIGHSGFWGGGVGFSARYVID